MIEFKPYLISVDINTVPRVEGQFIFDKINKNFYIDTAAARILAYEDIVEDRILSYPTKNNFPVVGDIDKLYIDLSDNSLYRWDNINSEYISFTGSSDYYTKQEIDEMLVTIQNELDEIIGE